MSGEGRHGNGSGDDRGGHGHGGNDHGHGNGGHGQGPGYCLNIEGVEHDWREPTITMEQVANLGGWPVAQGVIMVLEDNSERTLAPGEVIELQAGHAFCRRVRWKRGFVRAQRIDAELDLLRNAYPGLEHKDGWVRIPEVSLPSGWNRSKTDVAFQIVDQYPGTPPYGLYVPAGLRFRDAKPNDYAEPSGARPLFGGEWGMFSWTIFNPGDWKPTENVTAGSNLLQWVRGFNQRFAEGV